MSKRVAADPAPQPLGGASRREARRPPGEIVVRASIALLAIGLTAVPILRQRALTASQHRMTGWLDQAGIVPPRELEYEPDPERVELRAARASLAAELDGSRHVDLSAAEEARRRQ